MSQYVLKLVLKKPIYVPLGANVAQFEAKSNIPVQELESSVLVTSLIEAKLLDLAVFAPTFTVTLLSCRTVSQ